MAKYEDIRVLGNVETLECVLKQDDFGYHWECESDTLNFKLPGEVSLTWQLKQLQDDLDEMECDYESDDTEIDYEEYDNIEDYVLRGLTSGDYYEAYYCDSQLDDDLYVDPEELEMLCDDYDDEVDYEALGCRSLQEYINDGWD